MSYTKDAKKAAAYCVKKFLTNDPWQIAQALNIHIVVQPLGNILGNYRYMKRIRWIFINEEIIENETLTRVVLAHELGHAIMHRRENCCFMAHHTLLLTSKIEKEANLFAAHLLITDELLQEYVDFTQDQFCQCTGYPRELIGLRLK